MINHITIGSKFLSRAFFALSLIGLLTTHGNSQTATSLTLRLSVVDTQGTVVPRATVVLNRQGTDLEITGVTTDDGSVIFENLEPGTSKVTVKANGFATLEKSVTVSMNEDNDFTLSIAPTPLKAVQNPCGGAVPCLKEKINSLWLPIPLRIARLLQYEYKRTETPGTVQVGIDFIQNPQDDLHQHNITLKFAELFPDRLTMFKRGSDYLKKNPEAAGTAGDRELARAICDDDPLITCMTKGGNWFKRALMGSTISGSLGQRSLVQQQILVEPTFEKKYQVGGGFTFDPAKLFPSVSNWRGMLDEVQRIDKALALIGAKDVREGKRPWEHRWSVIFPKVDFKILTQFDFVKVGGVLVEAPFPERALNTWTFSWDLTRLIPDTKNRIDEDAIYETLDVLKSTLGKADGWKKRCVIQIAGEPTPRIIKDLHPGFSADSCQELAQIMLAQTYQLSCVKEGSVNDDGNAVAPSVAPARTINNYCKW
jgi:hypothetical protein